MKNGPGPRFSRKVEKCACARQRRWQKGGARHSRAPETASLQTDGEAGDVGGAAGWQGQEPNRSGEGESVPEAINGFVR